MKRIATLLAILALSLLSQAAAAGEAIYSKALFDQLMAEGKPVVIDMYADWCPTCKSQKPHVQALAADPAYKDVTILVADFDKEKELKKALRVSSQSTFVVFKGGKEVARSTGQTK